MNGLMMAGGAINPLMMAGTGLALADTIGAYYGAKDTNEKNREIAEMTNKANAEIAQKQMNFQEAMSNSAYQRGMADMKAAGLNPMLAYQQGGASTAPGAGIPAVSAQFSSPLGAAARQGVSSALDVGRLGNQMSATGSQNALNQAHIDTAITTRQLNASSAKAAEQAAQKSAAETASIRDRLSSEKAKNKLDKQNAERDLEFEPFDAWNKRVNSGLSSANEAKDLFTKASISWKKSYDRPKLNPNAGQRQDDFLNQTYNKQRNSYDQGTNRQRDAR